MSAAIPTGTGYRMIHRLAIAKGVTEYAVSTVKLSI
jgi:hypothetical protein